jgi:hypothetical protein
MARLDAHLPRGAIIPLACTFDMGLTMLKTPLVRFYELISVSLVAAF